MYALLIFGLIYTFEQAVSIKIMNKIYRALKPILFLGKHSLYIFLYHSLFIYQINKYNITFLENNNSTFFSVLNTFIVVLICLHQKKLLTLSMYFSLQKAND